MNRWLSGRRLVDLVKLGTHYPPLPYSPAKGTVYQGEVSQALSQVLCFGPSLPVPGAPAGCWSAWGRPQTHQERDLRADPAHPKAALRDRECEEAGEGALGGPGSLSCFALGSGAGQKRVELQ